MKKKKVMAKIPAPTVGYCNKGTRRLTPYSQASGDFGLGYLQGGGVEHPLRSGNGLPSISIRGSYSAALNKELGDYCS